MAVVSLSSEMYLQVPNLRLFHESSFEHEGVHFVMCYLKSEHPRLLMARDLEL